MKIIAQKFNFFLITLCLSILSSCSPQSSIYNLGIKNNTPDSLVDVTLFLNPQGEHPGFRKALPNQTGWYMDIKHWPPPKTVVVNFIGSDGKSYKFTRDTLLPENFCGDILIIIKKNGGSYYIEIKTGKLNELS